MLVKLKKPPLVVIGKIFSDNYKKKDIPPYG
jgi:hypothetical protein